MKFFKSLARIIRERQIERRPSRLVRLVRSFYDMGYQDGLSSSKKSERENEGRKNEGDGGE